MGIRERESERERERESAREGRDEDEKNRGRRREVVAEIGMVRVQKSASLGRNKFLG